jgi:hypothetical protein
VKHYLEKKTSWAQWYTLVIPATWKVEVEWQESETGPGQKIWDPIWKINLRVGGYGSTGRVQDPEFKPQHLGKKKVSAQKRKQLSEWTEWERIFASHSSHKGLMSRIYKEPTKWNTKRINNPINKWANELNRQLWKEVQMASKYIKKYSIRLAIREIQIKITPVTVAIIKSTDNNKSGGDAGEPSHTVGRNVSQCSHYGNQHGGPASN